MRIKLKLGQKLFLNYSFIIVIILLAIFIPAYFYLNNTVIKNTNDTIKHEIGRLADEINSFAEIGNTITKMIYYNDNLLDAMDILSMGPTETEKGAAYKKINNDAVLLTWLNTKIHRFSIYNEKGDFFSNKDRENSIEEVEAREHLMEKATKESGTAVFSYYSNDPWGINSNDPVISYSRQLTRFSRKVGFLEIQIKLDDIIENLKIANLDSGRLYIFSEKNLLYPNEKGQGLEEIINSYIKLIGNNTEGTFDYYTNKKDVFVTYKYSSASKLYIVYSVDQRELYKSVYFIRNINILIFIALISISLLAFYILSRVLTKPLQELSHSLQDADILSEGIIIENRDDNDELKTINDSFKQMRISLKKTMEKNVRARTLQLKAHFDALQAQINPHFIFNMLGIIAISSDRNGAKDAADMCRKLANFLRYSISSSPAYCSMGDEIQFLREYLELLKYRYDYRLEYSINIEDELLVLKIPKLSLQPLVENSIIHGFRDTEGIMSISIEGKIEGGKWEIIVSDNGCGIFADILKEINRNLADYSRRIIDGENINEEFTKHMGIVNTYARFDILYNNEIEFNISDAEEGCGTRISISGRMIGGKSF